MEKSSKNKPVRPVPEGFRTVTPYLIADNAPGLIEFMERAFDGKVTFRMDGDDGKITHATVAIGDSTVMLADAMNGMSPQTAMLYLYLEDADATFRKAVQANATVLQEPKTEFYGDRAGAVKDQWGNVWWMATHVEDVDEDELQRRAGNEMEERKKKGDRVHA